MTGPRFGRRGFLSLAAATLLPRAVAAADLAHQDWTREGAANGVPNLHRVTETLWRSGQPDRRGLSFMADLGVRTVLNLRGTVSDARRTEDPRLTLVRVPMKSRNVAEDDGAQIVAALTALDEGLARGPVLVHCRFGSDRTGCIVALYRMLWQDWPRAKAIAEMTGGPYGFHDIFKNIPRYLEEVDLDTLRDRLPA